MGMKNMLQPSDGPYIKLIVSPLNFKLDAGRVTIIVPDDMVAEERDETGKIILKKYVSPLTQNEIERRVDALKRMDRQAAMAAHFVDNLTILESVLIQYYQRTGNDQFDASTGDKELALWLQWRRVVLDLFASAKAPSDVDLPAYPHFPSWHRQDVYLKELALRLGYSGPFNAEVR
jgi:hypothetical protein